MCSERIFQFIRPSGNSAYGFISSIGLKCLTRFRLGLNHLCEYKFNHNFLNLLNPICNCAFGIEFTRYYLLYCPNFVNNGTILLKTFSNINADILSHNDTTIVRILLYGDPSLNDLSDTSTLNVSKRKRFRRTASCLN